jgi:predicted transcriptional regulator
MDLHVPRDLETKLARAADRRFLREVEKGLAQVERGEVLTHEEVGARLERPIRECSFAGQGKPQPIANA